MITYKKKSRKEIIIEDSAERKAWDILMMYRVVLLHAV